MVVSRVEPTVRKTAVMKAELTVPKMAGSMVLSKAVSWVVLKEVTTAGSTVESKAVSWADLKATKTAEN